MAGSANSMRSTIFTAAASMSASELLAPPPRALAYEEEEEEEEEKEVAALARESRTSICAFSLSRFSKQKEEVKKWHKF